MASEKEQNTSEIKSFTVFSVAILSERAHQRTQSFRRREWQSFLASSAKWQWHYKSHRSFPRDPTLKVQKQSNPPLLGLQSTNKVDKSCAMPAYVPGVTTPVWPLISA